MLLALHHNIARFSTTYACFPSSYFSDARGLHTHTKPRYLSLHICG
jgi:hypothetical protein